MTRPRIRDVGPLLSLLLLAAACISSEPEAGSTTPTVSTTAPATSTTTAPTVPQGGDLTVQFGINLPVDTINPFLLDPGLADSLDHLWRPRAIEWDDRGRLVPDVAVTVPTVENGGVTIGDDGSMVVRYQIREEAVWADGVPISGDDFVFTHEVLQGSHEIHQKVARIEVDEKNVVVEFAAVEPNYVELFGGILPRHDIGGRDPAADFAGVSGDTLWISGGPFILAEIDDEGAVRFVRNDAYWKTDGLTGESLPRLDSVTFMVPHIETRFVTAADLIVGVKEGVDFQFVGPADLLEVQGVAETTADFELIVTEFGGLEHLFFQFGMAGTQLNPSSLVHLAAFRRAIAYALDPGAITAAAYGDLVTPTHSVISLAAPSLSLEPWVVYERNLSRAAELLDQACAEAEQNCVEEPPVIHLTAVDTRTTRSMVEAIAGMLDEVGVVAEIDLSSDMSFLDTGAFDAAVLLFRFGPGLGSLIGNTTWFDPACNMYRWGTPEGGPCDWDNPGGSRVAGAAVDRYSQIVEELESFGGDTEQIAALALEAEAILADEMVVMPLHLRPDPVLLRRNVVGYNGSSVQQHFWNIEMWGFER